MPTTDRVIPFFGHQSRISTGWKFRLICKRKMIDAADCDGARLRGPLLSRSNTASDVWIDTVFRSKIYEDFM